MTPFGEKIRELRRVHGVKLKDMAAVLQVSPAYLSALEHGHRGKPTPGLVRQVCGFFDIIWDEEEVIQGLANISHPKVTLDTSGLSVRHTEFANRLAQNIRGLDSSKVEALLRLLESPR